METPEKVKSTVGNTKQKIGEKMNADTVKGFVDQVQDVTKQVQHQVGEYTDRATDRAMSAIRDYPLRSTLIALGVGFTVGSMFSFGRRHKS